MNAGAEGTETGQVIRSVTRVTSDGEIETLKRKQLTFEYRKTIFPDGDGIIIEAELEMEEGDRTEIQNVMDRHLSRRLQTQPLTVPNSGSVFKNPDGDTAGRLIESIGLKGLSVGDAGVSIKHANFIVNKGGATAKEVNCLIENIQEEVMKKTGIELQTDIVRAGE